MMDEMAQGNGKEFKAGLRLILEEIRDLRREGEADRRQAAEDRRQAAEDRKKYAEEQRRFSEEMRRFAEEAAEDRRQAAEDRRRISAEAAEDRRGIRDALVVIGRVGRRIVQTQERHTKLLEEIRDLLRLRGNGR